MPNHIVLISDDSDFFDYIKTKLELRKSDELLTINFAQVPDKLSLLQKSVLIVNSENAGQKTIDLLNIFNYCTPIIVTAYNDDEVFKRKCYRAGMLDFIPLLTTDAEFRARMLPALNFSTILEKNEQYRKMLVKTKILDPSNEIFLKTENIIETALKDIKTFNYSAVFAVISADEKSKYTINPKSIETFLLNNIRKTDILIKQNYNKYFLIMYNTNLTAAKKHWHKITKNIKYKLHAGFVNITNQNQQQLINSAFVNLNAAINENHYQENEESGPKIKNTNFKLLRQELAHKIDISITPVLYRIQQKYINKLTGVKIEQFYNNGKGYFNIIGRHFEYYFKISCPGFSKINIDISLKKENNINDSKRISFTIEEFDGTLFEDLLEQFIAEVRPLCT